MTEGWSSSFFIIFSELSTQTPHEVSTGDFATVPLTPHPSNVTLALPRKKQKHSSMQCSFPFASHSRPTPSNQTKTSASNDHYEFRVGEEMEGFRITGQLGEGTFGRVLEGEKKGRRYAIKVKFLLRR